MMIDRVKTKTVSFCILTYNQEEYISKAINSALQQTYSPLEIIISDDFSSDSTFQITKEIIENYKGNHKIILNRNNKNLGVGAHFSKVYDSIASGEYLIGLGGDDLSKNYHAAYAVQKMEENKNVNLIDFSAEIINEKGKFQKKIQLDFELNFFMLEDYIKLRRIKSFAPGRIIRRELISCFPPINENCPTEDSVFVFRSLLTGGFIRINEPLIYYRKHNANISSSIGLSKLSNHAIYSQYMKDLLSFFDKGFINETQLERLVCRLNFELAKRKLLNSNSNNNWYYYLKKRFNMRILLMKYWLNIF